jgi:hypothetical protein
MTDFEHRLTAVLDDIASSVRPHPDADALFVPTVTTVPNHTVRIFRPRLVAAAAAGLVLVGGSAFAMEQLTADPPSRVTPAATPVTEPNEEPTSTTIAPATTTTVESVVAITTPGKPLLEAKAAPEATPEPTVPLTEPTVPPTEPTEPPTEPPVAPVVIEFTAKLGANGQANNPMTQGFYGNAQPGSAIRIGSEWGVAETVAGPEGHWEATLVMPEVPAGTTVAVRITSSTSERVREFTLQRPGDPAPPSIDFTANAALTSTDASPPFNEYWGTSTAGAVITITSPYGGAVVESNADGRWNARPTFPDAPVGETFNVHITSSKGEAVYDFPLTRVGPG